MQKTSFMKKGVTSIVLALIMVLMAAVFVLPHTVAYAATIKTSTLFTSANNMKYKGTSVGTELTVTNTTTGSVEFKNKLYMKDMKMEFDIKSDNFDKIVFSFMSVNHDEEKTEKIENKIELLRKEVQGGNTLDVRFIDGSLTDAAQKEITPIVTTAKFMSDGLVLEYTTGNVFKLTVGGSSYVMPTPIDGGIYYNEANFKIAFDEIDAKSEEEDAADVVAKVLLKSINTQSFAENSDNMIVDSVVPQIAVDYGTYNTTTSSFVPQQVDFNDMTESKMFKAAARANIDVPVRVYDVLQTSLDAKMKITRIKDGAGAAIAEADQKTDEVTGTNFYIKEAGIYKIEVSAKLGNEADSDTVKRMVYIDAKEDAAKPVIGDWYTAPGQFAAAGSSYQVKRPDITDANGVDTKYNVKYKIWYKAPASNEWSSVDGLSFTPSTEGLYSIKLQATDASGNVSLETSGSQQIEFRDCDPPKLTISNFPKKAYKDVEVTLPTGSVSDTVDSSPTKSYKVFYVGTSADGTFDEENDEPIEIKNNKFKPENFGYYAVVYTARDSAGFVTKETKMLRVVKDDRDVPNANAGDFWNAWTITLICVAGVCAIGIVVLIFVKPKDKKKSVK